MAARPQQCPVSQVNKSIIVASIRFIDTFSNMGWKVYRASELASFVLRGGVNFASLSHDHGMTTQSLIIFTMFSKRVSKRAAGDYAESREGL